MWVSQKTLVVSFFVFLFFTSCKYDVYPVFSGVNSIDIKESSSKGITIQSDLVFLNPNQIGGILQAKNIHILVNDIDLGTLNTPDFQVPAEKEFVIPITFQITYDKIIKNNILNNLLTSFINKELKIYYKGTVHYKYGIISYDYPIDYTEIIKLNKK